MTRKISRHPGLPRPIHGNFHKVCTELGLRFGRCKSDTKAVLVKEGITATTDEQLKEALDHVEQEHHAIVFLYKYYKVQIQETN